ncbi:hypothetical protein BO78DRAFT_175997 [Aspergillus sclerotiicarbonarius CBS 121057]|uniref:Uncharacterized protein n=1 Tax=Aspergillus sclerotiicarbonarius (strain CBS 121057 / IBT 28362) TaxID=1448318 RepID=A0A319E2M1_ASPSB|nr:hypothetical protein BO78DRAFT_175997 [Aspergillus sclerotiicarbonarius CBS 121057]
MYLGPAKAVCHGCCCCHIWHIGGSRNAERKSHIRSCGEEGAKLKDQSRGGLTWGRGRWKRAAVVVCCGFPALKPCRNHGKRSPAPSVRISDYFLIIIGTKQKSLPKFLIAQFPPPLNLTRHHQLSPTSFI